jgi:hypothetical protein
VRAAVAAIANLFNRKKGNEGTSGEKGTNESYMSARDQILLQEQVSALIGKIASVIFKLAGVAMLLAVGIKVLDELSGGKMLNKLVNSDAPYAGFFKKLKEMYDKVDSKLNELFGKETKKSQEEAPKQSSETKGPKIIVQGEEGDKEKVTA